MKRIFLIGFLVLVIAGCASHPPAPVINRSPQSTTPQQATTPGVSSKDQDWRPNSYTVKKGDTLYSIGLEFGYDYREIAAANNIYAPYPIKVGQTLNFSSLNKETTTSANPTSYENEDGVIITPIDIVPDIEETANTSSSITASGTPPVLTAPKAIREPYSLEAFNRSSSIETNTATVTATESATATEPTTEIKPAEASTTTSKTASSVVDGVTWSWPTQGKVSAPFNAATNKGIDIAGKSGQAITASASGKVIYTGSDLRGYGKLVIIKHSNALLSVYAHNSKITIKEGQIVKAGQKIAEMGDTDASNVKLHFEIRQKGKSVDPALFLPKN